MSSSLWPHPYLPCRIDGMRVCVCSRWGQSGLGEGRGPTQARPPFRYDSHVGGVPEGASELDGVPEDLPGLFFRLSGAVEGRDTHSTETLFTQVWQWKGYAYGMETERCDEGQRG